MTLFEKAWIIQRREEGKKPANIAKEIERPALTIYTVPRLQQGENHEPMEETSSSLGSETFRGSQYPDEAALLEWWREKHAMCPVPLSHALLQEKASACAEELGVADFSRPASSGFISRFKEQNSTASKLTCSDSVFAPQQSITAWKKDVLPKLLEQDRPQDIFNADGTGLFFSALLNETLRERPAMVGSSRKIA